MKQETIYVCVLTLLYFIVSFFGILHHELFLDEAHHWLLARDSTSLINLIENTRMEGHPIVWSLLLYTISRFTLDPFWMQFLNILISTSVVFLFLRKAPFNWVFKGLFIFGYFMIFEYNLISRNYMLGILFLFLACSIFEKRKEKFALLCIYLAMASNVHLMFSVIAFALFLTVVFENLRKKEVLKKQFFLGYLVFSLGLFSIIIQIIATNSNWLLDSFESIPFQEKITKGFVSLFKGLLTIPDFRTLHFWNSNFLVTISRPISFILAVLVYVLPLLLFFKNKKTLFFVYVALIGTQIFFFITQRGATRFHGMTYIIIIIGLWIENYYIPEASKLKNFLTSINITFLKKPFIYGILILHFFSGIYAFSMDYTYPFTSGKSAIDFLQNEKLDRKHIVTITCDGAILSAYLQRKIYTLCPNDYQSFCNWDNDCFKNMQRQENIDKLTLVMDSYQEIIYVSYYPIADKLTKNNWTNLNHKIKVRFLEKFDEQIVEKTNYYVFEISNINSIK